MIELIVAANFEESLSRIWRNSLWRMSPRIQKDHETAQSSCRGVQLLGDQQVCHCIYARFFATYVTRYRAQFSVKLDYKWFNYLAFFLFAKFLEFGFELRQQVGQTLIKVYSVLVI